MLLTVALSLLGWADAYDYNYSYYFFSMGDWGGSSDDHPTTAVELNNAKGMVAASAALGGSATSAPRAVLLPGDNFYPSGIHNGIQDRRFQFTFEDAFPVSEPAFTNTKFYPIAGNHDHFGAMARIEPGAPALPRRLAPAATLGSRHARRFSAPQAM